MWKKSYVIFLSLLFFCCAPPLAFSQSDTPATWDNFDQLLEQARNELTLLTQRLTQAEQSLTASMEESARLKVQLAAQSIAVANLEQSLTQYRQSALTYESDLSKSRRNNWILGFVSVFSTAAAGYLLFN